MAENALYYGDNLDILRRYVADDSVDLVYLDPPFQSARNYNVLFEERDGTQAAAQIRAFEDTWRWDLAAVVAYEEVVEQAGAISHTMQALRKLLSDTDMMAYMAMMAPRLIELRRVLRPTGSLYLHCDPTAGHYLKVLLDAVFGTERFVSEIVWKRTTSHSDGALFTTRFSTTPKVMIRRGTLSTCPIRKSTSSPSIGTVIRMEGAFYSTT